MSLLFAAETLGEFFAEKLSGAEMPFCGCPLGPSWGYFLAAFVHAFILINVFALIPMFFIWLERKVAGRIQDRLGPTRVGGRFGWLQGLADGIKLIQKEDLVPTDADGMLFRMAPYLACIAAFGTFMVLPFSDGWVAVASDVGLFLLFAILSLEVLGIVLAGYSSGSKWSLFGGMREAAQMVSYEIPLALCGLIPVIAAGTLNLGEVGQMQSGWFFPNWLLFQNPFCFVAFFIYFTVATAGCKRAPFDLAEAESELVGGFHTEYSGMRWSFFFMAEYAAMFVVSGVATALFLGAWHTGIPAIDQGLLGALRGNGLGNYVANLVGMLVFVLKASALVFVQIWIRWTLPRLRIDQVMTTCLKYLVPMSCALFLGAVLWPLVLSATVGRTSLIDWPPEVSRPLGDRLPAAVRATPTPARPAPVEQPAKPHAAPAEGRTTSLAPPSVGIDVAARPQGSEETR